jgi:tryptophan halogenase
MLVKKIAILGGGSAGWMTASALSKNLQDVEITLIESSRVPTISVGESTLQQINVFLSWLGLKDEDWMPFCNAAYKNSIRFTDFREKDSYFDYPFGNADKEKINLWFVLKQRYPEYYPEESFATFVNNASYLPKYNKQSNNFPNFDFNFTTAYHFDASLFGKYLKEHIAIPNGVTHKIGDYVGCSKDESGNITSLNLEDGSSISADLFIDCTGFKSLLIEKEMGSKFSSFGETLINNKAYRCAIPYDNKETQLENFTNCTAIENGWVWNIPVWSRIGSGYVYSTKFTTEEEALQQYKNHISKKFPYVDIDSLEIHPIDIRNGKREKAWVKNVVAVGLSYGFLEPLESTGLLTAHNNILRLLDALGKRNCRIRKVDIDSFNFTSNEELEIFRSFVEIHYAYSLRDDTPYWRYVTENIDYSMKAGEDYLLSIVYSNQKRDYSRYSPTAGGPYILAGMGYSPIENLWFKNNLKNQQQIDTYEKEHQNFQFHDEKMKLFLNSLPSSYQYLKDNIYKK